MITEPFDLLLILYRGAFFFLLMLVFFFFSSLVTLQSAEAAAKPGVHWDTLHLLCHELLVEGFLALGLFKAEYASEAGKQEILASGITTGFLPHGLGHSLGLDVHVSYQFEKKRKLIFHQC